MDASKGRTFSMGLNSPEASRLRETVSHKLSEFMGSYTDDVLVEYVVVLVCNGKHQIQARKDLDAFLGDESGAFVAWLWDHLATNTHLYKASSQPLHFKGNAITDEQGKSSCERQAKRLSKEDVRRSTEEKARRIVDSEPLSKGAQVSFSTCEEVNDRCIKRTESIQKRDYIGCDNNMAGERRETPRPQTDHYDGDKLEPDESDQCEDLKHNSALKRQHSPDFWSGREQRLQDEKHAKKRISSSPYVAAPHRLLQSAVREAVTPLEMANSKRSESEVKRLRSMVVENADAATYTVLAPHVTNVYARSLPATAVAMRMDAAVAGNSNVTRIRSTGSVWDRLGKAFDKESNGLEEEVDVHMMDIGGRQKMENRLSKPDNRGHEHGQWLDIDSVSGRGFSSRLSKGLIEDKAMVEDEIIGPTADGKGYSEPCEDTSARCVHAHPSSSRGNGQLEESETPGVSRPLICKQGKYLPTKETDKSHRESLTVKYRLAQNCDKTISESQKQNVSSSGVADTSQKIFNISVNVNTWKRPHYQPVKDAVDGETAASSTGLKLLQDQTEMPVDDSLPDNTDTGLREEREEVSHESHQNDISCVRNRLHQVELEMAKLRAKQAEVCKDVQKTTLSTSGVETSLVHSEEDVDSRTVFVTNVHFAVTKEALSSHFNQCGQVIKVIMLTDTVTGQPKGSAFVSFASKEAAAKALALNGTSLLSRMLKVVQKTGAHLEPSPIAVRPPLPRGLPFVARQPTRVAHARGFPYAYRKGWMPKPYSGSQHLQWRRDASAGGSNGKSDPSVSPVHGPMAGMSPVSTLDGNLVGSGSAPFTHSLTYVRVPRETSSESPTPSQDQKGS